MEKKLIVLRGVPGSSKSTLAKKLVDEAYESGYMAEVCSADDYFLRKDGVYDWNPKLLKNAHQWCKARAHSAMIEEFNLIIIDNTNTRKKEYQPYLDMAEKYGYDVEEIIVGEFTEEAIDTYAKRNTHGVPYEKVLEMSKRFEF